MSEEHHHHQLLACYKSGLVNTRPSVVQEEGTKISNYYLPPFGGLDTTTATAIQSATPIIKKTPATVIREKNRINLSARD